MKKLYFALVAVALALLAFGLFAALRGGWPAGGALPPTSWTWCEKCEYSRGASLEGAPQQAESGAQEVLAARVEHARELLERARSCGLPTLREGEKLILEYKFLKDTFVEYDDGSSKMDLYVSKDALTLKVLVERRGGEYLVRFRLEARGRALAPYNRSEVIVDFAREAELLYDPERGYRLPNGTELGQFFPLFARPDKLELQVMWAKLGEPYSLARMRRASAERESLGVVDLERKVGVVVWANGTMSVIHLGSLNINGSYVGEVIERTRARRELGCPNLLGAARFASDEFLFRLNLDYIRGIPTLLHARGASRTLPTTEYVWKGKRMDETPALPLAELLGIRDYLAITLNALERG
jgi:hypothetical protein